MKCSFTILAAQSADRMIIYYPQKSTIRLVWKRTTLRFSVDEFRDLACSLEKSLSQIVDITEGSIQLSRCEDGTYELRVEDTWLHLAPIDYWMFGSMLEIASRQLTHGRHDTPRSWSSSEFYWN
jgi:hypothetical protein